MLNAGRITVSDEPLTAIVPIDTGSTGFCPCALAAVIWNTRAVPETLCPLIAVTCELFDRLIATNTNLPGVALSELAYTTTFCTLLDVACSEVSPKLLPDPSKSRNARNPASAYEYVPFGGQKFAANNPWL